MTSRARIDRCRTLAAASLLWLVVAIPGGALAAQQLNLADVHDRTILRSQLQELATEYRSYVESPDSSEAFRQLASEGLRQIELRLAEGDFSAGDIIRLDVQGEALLTDTFVVSSSKAVELPQIGFISLRGVLWSELERHLHTELARVIRDPRVTAAPLIQLAVLGEVNTPGFYLVPLGTPLTDVLMTAGGPTALADMTTLRIERSGAVLMEADIEAQNRTVAELNLRQGDRIVLPSEPPSFQERFQVVTVIVPILALLTTTYLALRR